jgi:hypothetical protein
MSCRILCLTTHSTHAHVFVDRASCTFAHCFDSELLSGLKALTGEARTDNAESVEETESIVPWTIVNKYYSADVHFEIKDIMDWSSTPIHDIPAVVFIWADGEVRSPFL